MHPIKHRLTSLNVLIDHKFKDLTNAERSIVMVLYRHASVFNGAQYVTISTRRIAQILQCDASRTRKTINSLIKKGLISRVRDGGLEYFQRSEGAFFARKRTPTYQLLF